MSWAYKLYPMYLYLEMIYEMSCSSVTLSLKSVHEIVEVAYRLQRALQLHVVYCGLSYVCPYIFIYLRLFFPFKGVFLQALMFSV